MINMYEFIEVDKAKEIIKQDLILAGVPVKHLNRLVTMELMEIEKLFEEEEEVYDDPNDVYNQRYISPYDVYSFNELF